MFKNAAKLSVIRSRGIKPVKNMERRSCAKTDKERSPTESDSVTMEHKRIHWGKEWPHFHEGRDNSEGFTRLTEFANLSMSEI